jgi:glycosyltransferase involved in cell wall biosynthesis
MSYANNIPVYDGIDWWWGLTLPRALRFIRTQRPNVVVLEWWTATTLHTYVVLALVAQLCKMRLVIEVHELQDPGEASFGLARWYGRWGLRLLLRLSDGCVVHSKADCRALQAGYASRSLRLAVAAHGPYDQYKSGFRGEADADPAVAVVRKAPRPSVTNILFFGLIRPYKGLEDLLAVFNGLSEAEVASYWLTVVGETWDGCTEPANLIANSPYRSRISFVNEYVSDGVVAAAFSHADLVVLPYRRSSGSGTLHIAMSFGLPVVVTRVAGLQEAAKDYEGAIFVSPGDLVTLKDGITRAREATGRPFRDPGSWAETVNALVSVARGSRREAESGWDHTKVPIKEHELKTAEGRGSRSESAEAQSAVD